MANQKITQYDRKVLSIVVKTLQNGKPSYARQAIAEAIYKPADNMAVRFLAYSVNALSKRNRDITTGNIIRYLRDYTNGMETPCKEVLTSTKSINN